MRFMNSGGDIRFVKTFYSDSQAVDYFFDLFKTICNINTSTIKTKDEERRFMKICNLKEIKNLKEKLGLVRVLERSIERIVNIKDEFDVISFVDIMPLPSEYHGDEISTKSPWQSVTNFRLKCKKKNFERDIFG